MAPNIALDFTVDGSGNVTLAASSDSADAAVIAALNAVSGPVGSVSYAPAFGTTFSIAITDTGDATRLTTQGTNGGLGVQGQNQNKIDRPGIEELYASPTFDGFVAALDVKSMDWSGAGGGDPGIGERAQIDTSTGTYIYPTDMTEAGTWDLSASNVYVNAGESIAFGNDHSITNLGSGYALAGFTFDLKEFSGSSSLNTTFDANPGTASATNVFTLSADGTATTASISGNSMLTEGLLPGASGSFTFTWEPVDQFDSNVVTGRVGTGWAYNGGDEALGPKTISNTTIGMGVGDAIIMTIATNDLVIPEGKFLRIDNLFIRSDSASHVVYFYDASEGTSTAITGAGTSNPTAQGDGVVQQLFQIVDDGDKIAFAQESGGQVRQYGFQFSTVEIKTDTDIPVNVSATGLDTAILLDWDDDASGVPLQEYLIYRTLASGVPSAVFTNVTESVFLDLAVTNGTEYFYTVSSVGTNGNESGLSAEVSAIPTAASTNIVRYQWLDASDASTVTTNASGELSLWEDKENAFNAVQGPKGPGLPELNVLWPSASLTGSGLSGMDVRTNRSPITALDKDDTKVLMDFSSDAALNSGFSVLVAFKADSVFQDNTRNIILGTAENTGGNNGFGLRYDRGDLQAFLNSSGVNTLIEKDALTDLPVIAGDTVVVAFSYTAADGAMSFWDSKNEAVLNGNAAPYGNFTNNDLFLAGSGNGGQFMDGVIGEVQIFSTTMSEAELVSRGEALALKWGATEGSGFDVWAGLWGVDIGSQTNDYDFDGLDNLAEYALNGNPTNAANRGQFSVTSEGGMFKYVYASNSADSALTYTFVDTTDLIFNSNPGTNSYVSTDTGATVGSYTTVTNNYDASAETFFVELIVEQD